MCPHLRLRRSSFKQTSVRPSDSPNVQAATSAEGSHRQHTHNDTQHTDHTDYDPRRKPTGIGRITKSKSTSVHTRYPLCSVARSTPRNNNRHHKNIQKAHTKIQAQSSQNIMQQQEHTTTTVTRNTHTQNNQTTPTQQTDC